MIEVEGRLCRGSVYFAGEAVKCKLIFKNVTRNHQESKENETKRNDTVAWASAQIVCFCNVSTTRVILPESFKLRSLGATGGQTTWDTTSLTPHTVENGNCVLETDLKILLCDLKLKAGESKEVYFSDIIPRDACPSYRGASVKYSYKITVAMQRVGAPVRVLRIPFRVLVLYGVGDFKLEHTPVHTNVFIPSPEPANIIDVASEVLSTITSRKAPHDYKIANSVGTIAVFTLLKSSVRLGEDIIGVFDFSTATVPCIQFTVYLQSEEEISEECRPRQDQGSTVISFEKQSQFCLFLNKTHIAVPVPLHCSPGFLTEIVGLRWRICFEFVISKGPLNKVELDALRKEDCMKQGPVHLDSDTVTWNIPVRILPTMPAQAEIGGSTLNACRLLL